MLPLLVMLNLFTVCLFLAPGIFSKHIMERKTGTRNQSQIRESICGAGFSNV